MRQANLYLYSSLRESFTYDGSVMGFACSRVRRGIIEILKLELLN